MSAPIIASLAMALFLTVIFVLLGSRGPWGSLWSLFLVLFLALWATSLFVNPIGPVYWGIAWVPLISAGILFVILLLALMPDISKTRRRVSDSKLVQHGKGLNDNELNGVAIGLFFWLLIILFVGAIIVGSVVTVY